MEGPVHLHSVMAESTISPGKLVQLEMFLYTHAHLIKAPFLSERPGVCLPKALVLTWLLHWLHL